MIWISLNYVKHQFILTSMTAVILLTIKMK